jgi:hypothetical protein
MESIKDKLSTFLTSSSFIGIGLSIGGNVKKKKLNCLFCFVKYQYFLFYRFLNATIGFDIDRFKCTEASSKRFLI